MVAEGTAHVYPRLAPTMEWDTAAADVIVREAGGAVLQAGTCTDKGAKSAVALDWFRLLQLTGSSRLAVVEPRVSELRAICQPASSH